MGRWECSEHSHRLFDEWRRRRQSSLLHRMPLCELSDLPLHLLELCHTQSRWWATVRRSDGATDDATERR